MQDFPSSQKFSDVAIEPIHDSVGDLGIDSAASKDWLSSQSQVIRVQRKDSAFFYAVFEASGGVVSYTTLSHPNGSDVRDIRLSYSPTTESDLERLLASINCPIEFF